MIKTDNVRIRKITLEKEEVMNKFNEINNMVENYWRKYQHKPNVIIISEVFSYGLRYMMTEREFLQDGFGNKLEYLFGIQCIESPVLEDFEFKIY